LAFFVCVLLGLGSSLFACHPRPVNAYVTDDPAGRPCYVARLDNEPTYTCKGHQHHGRCKHVDALLALQAKGSLDAIR
jgi:hypothetical protein